MRSSYPLIRRVLFRFPAESTHSLGLWAIRMGLDRLLVERSGDDPDPGSPILQQKIWGRTFSNPIGLAAGFDKDAKVWRQVQRWGFGFVEVGTLTPRPQKGNTKPRIFRLAADEAIINSMGFNNSGLDAAISRISTPLARTSIIGINIGANRDSSDLNDDYVQSVTKAATFADYLVVNVSSPNTPGLRDLQHAEKLNTLLRQLVEARDQTRSQVPLLVKIAPDLTPEECEDIANVSLGNRIDGLIVSNSTTSRPAGLISYNAKKQGGLSGRPLFTCSTELLGKMYKLTQGQLPLIGVGGVCDARDAYEKLRAGASLVQIHTALIFSGPAVVNRLKRGLIDLLKQDGFRCISEVVGIVHRSLNLQKAYTL